jgi:Tfp pilus assembly protein PilO
MTKDVRQLTRDNWMALGVLTALSAAYFLLVYRHQGCVLEEVGTATTERRRQLESDTLKVACVAPMMREIEAMKQRYNKDWDRRLPKRQELAGFLKEIAGNLSQERLSNQITRPGSPSRGPLYNCLPISMQFEGSFLALAGFLRRVDGMTRLTRVEQLTIEPKKDDANQDLSIVLGMNIYFTEY